MNKDDYLKRIKNFKLNMETKELLTHQIKLFYEYERKQTNKYKIGDEVLLSPNSLIHGTRTDLKTLDIISKIGLISSEFYSELNPNKKKPYVVELWDIKESIKLSSWIKKYTGVTIDFKNNNGDVYKSIICPFNDMKNIIQSEINFRDYIIYQNQEQRFLPNDIVENGSTMAFIVEYDENDELIQNDIFNENINTTIIKDILPNWFYEKYMVDRNFDNYETGREKAILFGIPAAMIKGIIISRKYENKTEYLKEIKRLFPNCYICNLDGKIIR